ncbi:MULTISPECIES: peptidylprolyl isomerase [Limnospira]|uniref:peptidylprolyl isomerase n=3 Tax=Limnospira TaxID=2596745 RepID=A0A9P1NX96_9CYAN|nr:MULTISPECIES: peptidylprolyl isomerase [unclassified Limnospira]MDC0840084.1 peptidylprolyl isomerase [Limnoraphis robusta]QJB27961.1 peptidylprolyl isomerase [Limnospira fusiformis SAG 85.79]QNH58694.1 MAG: peptidylprolyl isomerase [Limnospira indica BM01]RAQ42866.1 peptidylprolyl isomerase [Arthrospira sp. O9.13F]CDM93466.1 putative Peptidyl-prolyl cis-trans isomerase, cyclophilin family [Limnospira indica PCC 8005]
MLNLSKSIMNTCKRWLKTGLIALLLCVLSVGLSAAWWDGGNSTPKRESVLPAGNAITDGKALLRYALPIDNEPIRKFQGSLEEIADRIRGKRWSPIKGDITTAARILSINEGDILASIPDARQAEAKAIIEELRAEIERMRSALDVKDGETLLETRASMLSQVTQLQEMMVGEFPFEVPAEYANIPQLKGRATVKMTTSEGDITLVVDGYSAPVTAGNFVDLVQRGFYDGLEFIRSEESYVLQVGDPPGPEEGFIDPDTGEYRAVPLEILVRGDDEPTYGITLEAAGRYRDQPVLPFSAYGTVAMARPESDPDGGSSQFFFFLFEPELTPAGLNLLDGRYSVFGYVTEGKEVLRNLTQGDAIASAKVIQGLENLVQPKKSA